MARLRMYCTLSQGVRLAGKAAVEGSVMYVLHMHSAFRKHVCKLVHAAHLRLWL
jgi:hypothetical protein